MSRLLTVADYLHSGQRWFQHWKGIPFVDVRFSLMLDWINFYGSEITSKHPLNISEIGPNGGKYTYTVLRQLQSVGLPQKVNYTIYGSDVEHTLTLRDGVRTFDPDCKYGKTARVRTHVKAPEDMVAPNLITELTFIKKDTAELKLSDTPQQLILCLDSFSSYPKDFQERIFTHIRNNLAYAGTFIFSVPTRSQNYFTGRLKLHFKLLGSFIVDDMTYCAFTNNFILSHFGGTIPTSPQNV